MSPAARRAGPSRRRYGARDLPALLGTEVGRRVLRRGLEWLAWYPVAPVAALYRRTWLAGHPIVAVTGTFGKTTACAAIAAALGARRPPTNFRTYLAAATLRLGRGSPPGLFEVGISGPGQMASRARLLAPTIAVVTAVGSEHSTSLGSLDDVAREKRRLLERLDRRGLAILNGDDPRVRAMAAGLRARVVRYGLGEGHEVRAEAVRLDWPRGTRFELVVPEGRFAARVRPLGRPAVAAALAAVAVARELGRPIVETLARLERGFEAAPGRLESVPLPNGAWVLRDDYKAQHEVVETALDLLDEIPALRKLVVLGPITEPPRPARAAYRRLGERLGGIDRLIGCGPFRSHFETLAGAARRAGLAADAIRFHGSATEAIAELAAELRAGDVLLLKGQKNLRLERIALALAGRRVGCALARCYVKGEPCAACPMLGPGWGDARPVT